MFSRSLLAGLAGVVLLAISTAARAVTYNETFVLTGAQAIPPTSSTGFGAANVTVGVDTVTHTLAWDIIFTGLTGPLTGAEFRLGATAQVNIGAISGLVGPELTGSTTVTATQTDQIVAGQWSLILATSANPTGEIAGTLPGLATTPVPEPATLSLLTLAAAAVALRLTRRKI